MSSFAQTNTGDFDLSSGNLVVVQDPGVCTAAKLSNLFGLVLGEWFRDVRIGVPYFQYVFVKNPNLLLIDSLFRKVLLSAPGVSSVTSVNLTYDPAARTLGASFVCVGIGGSSISGGLGQPFIVSVNGNP